MAKHVETSDIKKTFNIESSNDTWIFDESFSVKPKTGFGIYIDTQYTGNRIEFNGTATGDPIAIASLAKNTDILIGEDAKFSGFGAVGIGGSNSSITNAADISTDQAGLYAVSGVNQVITNEGKIHSINAMGFSSSTANGTAINAKGAVLSGEQYGISIESSVTGVKATVENHGKLSGGVAAINAGAGNETIINTGAITGDVKLGDGNDTFRNEGGTLKNQAGGVTGGFDNDTLITDNAKIKLIEELNGGDDTVKSSVSYKLADNVENLFLTGKQDLKGTGDNLNNALHGNAGDNVLKGLLGSDHLYGGKGSDTLFGGGDVDTFHFATGDGKDTVADFENGYDFIDVSAWKAIADYADLIDHHIEFKHGDAIITAGKDVLTIENVTSMDLDETDFKFAV